MKAFSTLILTTMVAILLLLVCPVQADTGDSRSILYQTAFSADPRWTTNNPSSDYWDPNKGMYHFSIEPGSGNYAWVPVEFEKGSFTLEYDLSLLQVDDGSTFRLGFSGTEMDRSKGPNVISEFTVTKNGQVFVLRLVTQSAKLSEVTSESSSYNGPTVHFDTNKTYHIFINYDDDKKTLTERVTEKTSGKQVWSYYLNTWDTLTGMNRLYIGAVGDYGDGRPNRFATGYIDNVRLYTISEVTVAPTQVTVQQTSAPAFTSRPTTRKPTTVPTTPVTTPTSAPSVVVACGALGIIGAVVTWQRMKKNR
ncbi:MAG: hypothetical protein STSR0009_13520 [Methanoregula sp.]